MKTHVLYFMFHRCEHERKWQKHRGDCLTFFLISLYNHHQNVWAVNMATTEFQVSLLCTSVTLFVFFRFPPMTTVLQSPHTKDQPTKTSIHAAGNKTCTLHYGCNRSFIQIWTDNLHVWGKFTQFPVLSESVKCGHTDIKHSVGIFEDNIQNICLEIRSYNYIIRFRHFL